MTDVKVTDGFPARNHFPVQVALGAGPRAQQVICIKGQSVLPVGPRAKPAERQDEDEDGQTVFDVERGDPGLSWTDLMRQDAQQGFGGPPQSPGAAGRLM